MKTSFIRARNPWEVVLSLKDKTDDILFFSEMIFDFTLDIPKDSTVTHYSLIPEDDTVFYKKVRNYLFLLKKSSKYKYIIYDCTKTKVPSDLLTYVEYAELLNLPDREIIIIHNDPTITETVPSELEVLTNSDGFTELNTSIHKYFFNDLPRLLSVQAREYGLPLPKGALLVGIPGTGKTILAHGLSDKLGVPTYRLAVNRLFNKYVGDSEKILAKVLEFISSTKAVLFIDEFDKLFTSSQQHEVTTRLMSMLLTFMNSKKECYVLLAANRVANIPIELLRKGRIDRIFYMDLPNVNDIKELIASTGVTLPKNITPESLIGYTPSEVIWLCNKYKENQFLGVTDEINYIPYTIKHKAEVESMIKWAKEYADL